MHGTIVVRRHVLRPRRGAYSVVLCATTVIANAGKDETRRPSETRITMLLYVPACVLAGVPESVPLPVLNEAHAGLFEIVKVSVLFCASLAEGVKV